MSRSTKPAAGSRNRSSTRSAKDKIYAVEWFGSFSSVIGSGLHFVGFDVLSCCISFRSITKRVEQNDVFVETKTKDNVFVLVKVSVQQTVIPDQAESAIYKLANVSAQIDSYVSDVVRSHVPKMNLDEAFENKDAISMAVQETLTKSMFEYGFQIIKALVTELKPSQDVMNSMNEINKQKRLRDAAVMASEADKIKVVKKAEADCEAARLQGEGIAKQREAIVEGLKRSVTGGTDQRAAEHRQDLRAAAHHPVLRDAEGSRSGPTRSPTRSSSRTARQMASGT
ncbi:unnamed protein product, partial [Prorocentrum cordatum]